jgi:hypothetical protein
VGSVEPVKGRVSAVDLMLLGTVVLRALERWRLAPPMEIAVPAVRAE